MKILGWLLIIGFSLMAVIEGVTAWALNSVCIGFMAVLMIAMTIWTARSLRSVYRREAGE